MFLAEIARIPEGEIRQMKESLAWPARVAAAHTMLREGVHLPPSQFEALFVSLAHEPDAIDQTLEALRFGACHRAPKRRDPVVEPTEISRRFAWRRVGLLDQALL